jgi:ABC-2 type transport system permease protein
MQSDFHLNMQAMILMALTIAGMSTVYATIICYISKSEVQANITAAALATIMSLLGGTFISVAAMPWLLRMLSYASPIRWITELLRVVLR